MTSAIAHDLADLLTSGQCTGACLMSMKDDACDCRCGGKHHGKALTALDHGPDGLVGMCLQRIEECPKCGDARPVHNGIVTRRVHGDLYLYRPGFGAGEMLAALPEMTRWRFYPNQGDMLEDWEYGGLESASIRHYENCTAKEEN